MLQKLEPKIQELESELGAHISAVEAHALGVRA
jgi:hypothetical protein